MDPKREKSKPLPVPKQWSSKSGSLELVATEVLSGGGTLVNWEVTLYSTRVGLKLPIAFAPPTVTKGEKNLPHHWQDLKPKLWLWARRVTAKLRDDAVDADTIFRQDQSPDS